MRHLEKGRVVIFAGGTGNPFFTTDTAAALRAAEIDAEAILKGTHSGVDGVYTADPQAGPDRDRYDEITYIDVIDQGPQGDGRDGHHVLPGQQHPDRGVRHVCTPGQHAVASSKATPPGRYAGRTVIDGDTVARGAVIRTRGEDGQGGRARPGRSSSTVRTGRATPALVEKLLVEYYGAEVPLQQLAGFQVPEARQLIVKPHDRAALGAIERAIRDSDLGINPANDGVVIRLNFPPLTEERRKEYVKVVKHMAEDGPGRGPQPPP